MIGRALDAVVGTISPGWQVKRLQSRIQLARYRNATLEQINNLLGTGNNSGYSAVKQSRLSAGRQAGVMSENAFPRDIIRQLRSESWALYRDNTNCKKLLNQIESKVVGRGPKPSSQATTSDGKPFTEFRSRAHKLWRKVGKEIDYRGKPGRGGQHMVMFQKAAIRGTVLGGEILYRFRDLSSSEQKQRGLLLPFAVQQIHAERLDESIEADNVFAGIEFGGALRTGYHILDAHPSESFDDNSERIPAKEMGHLYVELETDQHRGVPWMSSALMKSKDLGDYEYNELTAAAMAACVVLGYRRSTGHNSFGLENPADWELTDGDGNKVTNIGPGMFLDLGTTGDLVNFNPGRPNSGAEAFIQHLQRSSANSVPGVKGTSITQDYRNSSFSSERSADNDVWPEIEGVQDWFQSSFCQPIYEKAIEAGVREGFFDNVKGFSQRDFENRKAEYLECNWQGPVARSINPKEDAKAAQERLAGFTSSPQLETAFVGRTMEEILEDWKEFADLLAAAGIINDPEKLIMRLLGFDMTEEFEDPTESEQAKDESAKIARNMTRILHGVTRNGH